MKKSQFKNIIREEIKNILTENDSDTVMYAGVEHEVMRRVDDHLGKRVYIRRKEPSHVLGKLDTFWVKEEDLNEGMVPDWPEEVQAYDMDVVFMFVDVMNNGNARYDIVNKKTNKVIGNQIHGSIKQLQDSAADFIIPSGATQSSQF